MKSFARPTLGFIIVFVFLKRHEIILEFSLMPFKTV